MTTATLPVATQLMDLVSKATQPDIDLIDAKIAELDKEHASLMTVRKLLVEKVHGKKQRQAKKKTGTVATGGGNDSGPSESASDRCKRIAKLLAVRGPLMANVIASELGLPSQGLHFTLGNAWFEKMDNGLYRLTAQGRRDSGV